MRKRHFTLIALFIATMLAITGCVDDSHKSPANINATIGTQAPTTEAPTTEAPTTQTPTTQVPTTQAPTTQAPKPTKPVSKFGTTQDILRVCSIKATCETNISACYVDVNSNHNPYDVVWNYGYEYQEYVNECDWSLVWDYDYYIKTFPMLAELYHYNKDLLLEHFQTVGIHEGRQGSANFNVEVFKTNSNCANYNDNYAAYYFDYMLNYDSYKNILYKNNNSASIQYKICYTAAQARELDAVNKYRQEVNAKDLYAHSELTCFANYRGYLNAAEGYYAHEWFELEDYKNAVHYGDIIAKNRLCISENCIEGTNYSFHDGYIYAKSYRASQPHYEAMINTDFDIIGVSHVYRNRSVGRGCQFDTFIGYRD